MEFFETSGRNLLAEEAAAGVGHHIVLSVVGTDRLLASGYFRAKMAQEDLIKASGIPYTIVRATQFLEFLGGIAQFSTVGQTVHLPPALWQPIAADDVASALAEVTLGAPVNGMIEIAGPERAGLDELVGRFLSAIKDPREVIIDVWIQEMDIDGDGGRRESGRRGQERKAIAPFFPLPPYAPHATKKEGLHIRSR